MGVSGDEIAWDFIRLAIKSSAYLAVFPLQDLMSLGSEARLNTPGAPVGNWQWRYLPHQLDNLQRDSSTYLREIIDLYGR
jgi:4-alpha-glucanotransferase